jgi:hypothetical protein
LSKEKKYKLDQLKADLEIKMVKMELQKLKFEEEKIYAKKSPNKTSKKEVKSISKKKSKTVNANVIASKEKKPTKKAVSEIEKTKENFNLKLSENEKIKIVKKTITAKPKTNRTNNSKSSTAFLKQGSAISINKLNNPKKKQITKIKTFTEKKKSDKKPFLVKNKILLYALAFIFLLVIIGFSYKNITTASNKEIELEQKNDNSEIDFSSDGYFKEVEDDLSDEDLQDFTVYKDVPEVQTNSKDNQTTNKPENIVWINNQQQEVIENNIANQDQLEIDKNINISKFDSVSIKESKPKLSSINNNDVESKNEVVASNNNAVTKNAVKNNNKISLESDYIKITTLQKTAKDTYIAPDKSRDADTFKVRVRLNKVKKTTASNKVKVMLAIKDKNGKILKIDVKELDFSRINSSYLTFHETLTKLKNNKMYYFTIYANQKIISKTAYKNN